MAAKYCSSGWQRDLEHVLKVYYKHTIQTPFREGEWARVREYFFDHLTPRKAEAVAIKEESPLDYMPYIAEEFHKATGLHLNDLLEFTLWIKQGSYFHRLLVKRGQVQQCPHLIGAPLPRWPQRKPSESQEESYRQAEGPVVGPSGPCIGATATPPQETPAEEPPMQEALVAGPSRPDTPAPMETGGAGDGQTWAEQVEISAEAEFQWARPLKHPRYQSRRWETGPRLPFPLLDVEGRLASIERLYKYAGEQPSPRDDVAGRAIRHLHPEILPRDAQRLGNQVSCMIAKYHLTSSTRVSTTMFPVLPEAAKLLLPAIKTYVSNISFEGTRDVRVLDCAKTLRVAVWLHHLDMAVGGDQSASETLDALRHCLGRLLESFLIPTTHDLTFREVVTHCLFENRCDAQHRLNDLVRRRNRIHEELDDLVEAHQGASGSSRKRIKKEIDLRRKDLESLKGRISHEESYLEQDVPESDDPLDQGDEVVMPPDTGVDDAPSESAVAPVSGSSPGEDAAMEVDEGAAGLPPTSPVSREDDDLLDENEAVEVEAGLAHLTVSSPSGQVREGEGTSVVEAPPPLEGEDV